MFIENLDGLIWSTATPINEIYDSVYGLALLVAGGHQVLDIWVAVLWKWLFFVGIAGFQ